MHVKSCCGWNVSYMSSGLSSSAMWYTVITRAPFTLVRILLFMQDRSTLMWGIIGWEMLSMTTCLNLRRYIPITMTQICWRCPYQGRSLKFVVQSSGWRAPPHNRKEGDLLGFSSCGRPKLRAQNLRHLRPLYKRIRRRITLFLLLPIFATTGGRRKRE